MLLLKNHGKCLLFLVLSLTFCSFANAQACGSSVRKIELEFAEKVKKPKKVSYELYFVAPIGKSPTELWDEKTTEFVSNFYYSDAKKKKFQFWKTGDDTTEFLIVSKEKAEKYLKNYKLADFKTIYESEYRKHQLEQLNGKFTDYKLSLKTGEMDNTPFLMKVSAKGFETIYLLADFLGGCHRLDTQKIKMKQG